MHLVPLLLQDPTYGIDVLSTEMDETEERSHQQPQPFHISLVKKSVAPSTSICIRMNSRHVTVLLRSGAGGMPWRLRILPTVWSLIV